ncbi:6700_t:CDS:2 [Gigaspora margarita]|uniref:6700_t:CDS:1 n=1 Tax=Gigaspora margarita TaxID=4874 RepID=A0ABM8VXU5_GIGMA|nr:6700_t:CDS:2 [Gigaspora margarita]
MDKKKNFEHLFIAALRIIMMENVIKAGKGIKSNYKDDAGYYLALHYKDRKPTKNDYKDNAKYYLALHYKDEISIAKDDHSVYKLLNQVAKSNSRHKNDAEYYLAFFYKDGICIEKDV